MPEAIGIRLEDEWIKKIEELGEQTDEDRSTVIRHLIKLGYHDMLRELAAQAYKEGKFTLSEAASRAGMSIWDFEHFLVDKGFKSQYSIEDLRAEAMLLARK